MNKANRTFSFFHSIFNLLYSGYSQNQHCKGSYSPEKDSSSFPWFLFITILCEIKSFYFSVISQPGTFMVSSFIEVLWSWFQDLTSVNKKISFVNCWATNSILFLSCIFMYSACICSTLSHTFFHLSLITLCWEGSDFYCHFVNLKRELEVFSVLFRAAQTLRRNSLRMHLTFLFWRI